MFKRTACLLSLALLLAALMAGCGGSGSVGGQDPGAAALEGMTPASSGKLHPPTVASTSPAKGATGVAINGKITAIFCQPMARATVTDATFTVMNGSTAVNGTVSFAYRTAIFTPDSNLAPNTEFTATLATGITTYGGLPLANPYIWKFTTGSTEDTVGPAVKSTGPWNGAKDVPTNRQPDVTFNEPIDPSTITKWTFTLKQGTKPVTGDAGSYHETNSTFTPVPILEPLTEYTATLSTGVKDLAGNAMAAPYVWKFTTGPRSDDTRPTVISTSPADGATQVSLNSVITVTFREMVAPSTVTRERFRVLQGTTPILGTVTYAGRTATFTPAQSLTHCTVYTAQMASGVKDKDLSGNLLANDFNWQFTTGLAPVELGLAAPFAVLGGSTVTSPVFSTVTGDLGVWSGTAVTGFPPSTLTGALHAGDAAAHLAQGDLTTAYNDAAGRTCSPVTVAGNQGGKTLTPGLYKSTSSLAISSGNLTLDAQGDAGAVFIFQVASTFTMTDGLQVILKNRANAANIYWQIGSSATIGSTCALKGTVLANQSITLNGGATLVGRALARIGGVTLNGCTVTKP